MRVWTVIGAVVGLGALAAATAAGLGGAAPALLGRPPLSTDIAAAQAEHELCAAAFTVDGRDAARRLGSAEDTGAGFAFRNDQFRGDWLINGLTLTDPGRNWRARVDALAARLPGDPAAPALARIYGDCLDRQNRDPVFTEALHAYLPYHDFP